MSYERKFVVFLMICFDVVQPCLANACAHVAFPTPPPLHVQVSNITNCMKLCFTAQ